MSVGTSLSAPASAKIDVQLNDKFGDAILIRCLITDLPSGVAGYAVGCLAQTLDAGVLYFNTSATSASFGVVNV